MGFRIGAEINQAQVGAIGGDGGEQGDQIDFGRQIEVQYNGPKIYPITTVLVRRTLAGG